REQICGQLAEDARPVARTQALTAGRDGVACEDHAGADLEGPAVSVHLHGTAGTNRRTVDGLPSIPRESPRRRRDAWSRRPETTDLGVDPPVLRKLARPHGVGEAEKDEPANDSLRHRSRGER